MAQEIADSTLIDTWSSSGLKVEPDVSKIIEGWQLGEQPPHEYMNWLQNTFGSKLNHILKNGVSSWNNETQYLAGSSVQHSGNVWLCKVTNTNSEPTDANANWKRIITVEALTTVLSGYVATTGNQTIAGIKTFTSSPIVPTPTAGDQAANKDYVEGNISALYNSTVRLTGNQTIAGIKTFTSSPIVPTPTASTQAVNKEYADLKIALTDFIGTNISLTGNGYQKLPSGLIIQWGSSNTVTVGVDSDTAAGGTFPIAFPNAFLSITCSPAGAQAGIFSNCNGTLTTFTGVIGNRGSSSFDGKFNFIAIGY